MAFINKICEEFYDSNSGSVVKTSTIMLFKIPIKYEQKASWSNKLINDFISESQKSRKIGFNVKDEVEDKDSPVNDGEDASDNKEGRLD